MLRAASFAVARLCEGKKERVSTGNAEQELATHQQIVGAGSPWHLGAFRQKVKRLSSNQWWPPLPPLRLLLLDLPRRLAREQVLRLSRRGQTHA